MNNAKFLYLLHSLYRAKVAAELSREIGKSARGGHLLKFYLSQWEFYKRSYDTRSTS